MIAFIFLSIIVPLALSTGHIHNWDYTVDYANTGYLNLFSFGFSLENGISSSDYLKLQFPFALHTSSTISNDFSVYLKLVGTSGCTPVQTTSTNVFLSASESYTYYIQFLDEKGQVNKPLNANTWYILRFELVVAFSITAGNYAPVQIFTVSSMSSTAIVYDYNRIFANIEISPAPVVNTLTLKTSVSSSTVNDIDAIYEVIFDIAPSLSINNNKGKIVILSQVNDWTFNGDTCISVDANVSQVLADGSVQTQLQYKLNGTDFTCNIDSVNNLVVIELNSAINALQHYVFSVSIRNPKYVVQNNHFEVRTMLTDANKIIELAVDATSFTVNPLNWGASNANLKLFLGWGVDASQASLPTQFKIYMGSAAVSPFKFYNALKFVFSPSYETATGTMLKIVLRLDAQSGFEVLSGSISENLPDFGENQVYCSLDKTVLTAFKVICYNVGVLSNLSNYHIGLKAFFPYSSTMDSNFGNLAIYTYNSNSGAYDSLPLIPEGRATVIGTIAMTNNQDGIMTMNSVNCYTFAHSQPAGFVTDVSSSNCGIKFNSNYQNLVFTLTPTSSQLYGASFTNNVGYQFYTTQYVTESTTYDALDPIQDGGNAISNDNTAGDPSISARAGHDYSAGKKWTWFKVYSSSTTINSFYWSSNQVFGVKNIQITSRSGNYAQETCFDFYAATYNDMFGASPIVCSTFAFNSYAISDDFIGSSDNLGVITMAIVNFWTGAASFIDGSKFPVFIRVTGYLDSTKMTNVKRLAIFFDNLDYFSSISSAGIDIVDCATSLSSKTTCYGYKGQGSNPLTLNSLHNLHRIEIDVEGTLTGTSKASPFQILIPVKSITGIASINLQFATMTKDFFYGVYKSYTSILNSLNTYYSVSYSLDPVLNDPSKILTLDYRLSFSGSTLVVGATASVNPATINCAHADQSTSGTPYVNPNASPNYGGGFTYLSEYDMIGTGFYVSGTILNTKITSERCLAFKYTYSGTMKYGFFCPFSQGTISSSSFISAVNFVLPYENGQKIMPHTYGLWSDNSGNLISYQLDARVNTFTAGSIALSGTGVTPALIEGLGNQQLNWTFTTSNPIPINGKVKVTFSASIWNFDPDVTEKCMLKANLLANDRVHTCTITKTTNSFLIFTFAAGSSDLSAFPPGDYVLIQYGVDKDSTAGIDLQFTLETFTSLGYLIDKTSSFAGTLAFSNILSTAQLTVSNIVFQTLTQGFRDDFSFQFSLTNKRVFFNEKIYVDLGVLASTTTPSQVFCSLYLKDSMSFEWASLDLSNLNSLILIPKNDIWNIGNVYTVVCEGVYIPSTNSPGMALTLLHQTTVIKASSTYSFPTFIAPYNGFLQTPNITLIKNINAYGHMSELVFSFVLGYELNSSNSIIINLPIQYNSRDFVNCYIGEIPVFCYYPRIHSIIIEGLNLVIPQETSFNVTLIGILNPMLTSAMINTQTTFLIGFNLSNDPTLLTYIGELKDVENQLSSLGRLSIDSASNSNPFILNFSNLTINFGSFPIDVQTTQSLILDLMDSETFGQITQRAVNMTCALVNQDTGANILGSSSCGLKGLKMRLGLKTFLNQSSLHTLTIKNLPTPENINCNIRKPMVYILDSDNATVLYRTNPASANFPTFLMKKDSLKEYFSWKNAITGKIIKHNQNVLELNIGMISNTIQLTPLTKAFFKFIGIDMYQTQTSSITLPSLVQGNGAQIGDLTYDFRIGCPIGISQQVVDIYLYKIEPGSNVSYANLEQISLSLIKTKFPVTPSRFETSIVMLGRALPIIFDFTEYCPSDYLLVTFSITYSSVDLGFYFEDTQTENKTVQISYSNPVAKLQVIAGKNDTNVGQSIIVVSFLGGNIDAYTYPTMPIVLLPKYGDPTSIPTLSILYDSYTSLATAQTLTVTVSETSSVYCYVALILSDSPTRDFIYTRGMADNGSTLNQKDRYQEQFLVWYVEDFTQTNTFTISNLRSKRNYNFTCWAINLFENYSSPNSGKFTTLDNGGKLMRFGLTFQGELNSTQKQTISCYLCSYFAIPCENVQSYDNYYCGYTSYKDLLQSSSVMATNTTNTSTTTASTTVNSTTSTTSNSTASSTNSSASSTNSSASSTNTSASSTNSSTSSTNSSASSTNSSNSTSDSTSNSSINYTYTSLNFYFLPLDFRESDKSYELVTEETQKSYFKSILAGNLSSLPNINYVQPISEVSEIDPEFDSTMTINSTVDGTWLMLSGLRMKSRGFILISMEYDIELKASTTNSTNATNSSSTNSSSSNATTANQTNSTSNATATNQTNSTSSLTNNSNTSNSSSSSQVNVLGGRVLTTTSPSVTVTTTSSDSTSSNTNSSSNDSLVLFKPSPAQIKLKLDSYNNSVLVSAVAFYNYTDASINITGLNYSTTYRVFYTVSSENPAVYCLLGSEVKAMRIRTLDKEVQTTFGEILKMGSVLIILVVVFLDILG